MNLSFKAAYKDNTQRKVSQLMCLCGPPPPPCWQRVRRLTQRTTRGEENMRVGEDRQVADGQNKTTQNWQPRNITHEKWPDVSPEVKALWQEKGNCVIYFSMGMSAWGMQSDYKPLNDLMCGLIALIFNVTLLDFPVTEGGNCSIHLG